MGQSQSHQQSTHHAQPPPPEPGLTAEERAQAQAEMRAKQQAALDKRFGNGTAVGKTRSPLSSSNVSAAKKPSALQQMSRENVGWREADAQAEMRSWN